MQHNNYTYIHALENRKCYSLKLSVKNKFRFCLIIFSLFFVKVTPAAQCPQKLDRFKTSFFIIESVH